MGTKKDCGRAYFLCSVKRKEVWVSGRNQHTANVPSSSRVPKVQILLLPQKSDLQERRSWRVVADCKSVAPRLSRFESYFSHKNKRRFGRVWLIAPVLKTGGPRNGVQGLPLASVVATRQSSCKHDFALTAPSGQIP